MTCQDLTNDLLLDYTDWQLPPHERNPIARHLDACENCRARRDDLEGMSGALRRSDDAPPAALLAQLDRAVLSSVTRITPEPIVRARPRRSFGMIALAGVAALVAVAAIAFVIGERTGRSRAPAVATKVETPAPRIAEPPIIREEPREPEPVRNAPTVAPKVAPKAPEPVPPAPEPKSEPAVEPGPTTTIVAQAGPKRLRGDMNGDGVVDIADARILQDMIMQGLPLPDYADVNGDGLVDLADVREILRAELALR